MCCVPAFVPRSGALMARGSCCAGVRPLPPHVMCGGTSFRPARTESWLHATTGKRGASPEFPAMRTNIFLFPRDGRKRRSEEHTSELQSLMRISYAVFCLKKQKRLTGQQELAIKTVHLAISHNT